MIKALKTSFFITLALTVSTAVGLNVNAEEQENFGAPIGDSPQLDLATIIDDPSSFIEKQIIVEGKVVQVCQKKGCWLELATTTDDGSSMQVRFEDYAFFVPMDSSGQHAKLEGKVVRQLLSKKEVDHLIEDGAKLTPDQDGTVELFSFLASAVELRKS